jgi:hypothetical protein
MKKSLLFVAMLMTLMAFSGMAQVTLLSENFEGNSIPSGWTLIDADGDGHQWMHSSNPQSVIDAGHNQSEGAVVSLSKISSTPLTPDNWLVTPAITLIGNSTLTFWRQVGWMYYAEHYGVYISTTSATDPSAFTLLYEETPTQSSAWTERTVSLSDYTGSTVYIAFRHYNCTNKLALALDDIVVTSEAVSAIITATPNTLHFPETAVGQSSNSQSVNVEAFNISSTVTASVTAPFEVSLDDSIFANNVTLAPGGQVLYVRYTPTTEGYDSTVMIITDGTVSTNVTLLGHSIDCNNITVPYENNFNDIPEYTIPGCWLILNPYYGGPTVTNNYSSDNVMMFKCNHVSGIPSYAVMPQMTSDLSNLQISFTTFRESYSSGTFSVGYMTNPNDGSTFVPVWSTDATQIGDNNPHSYLVSFENVNTDPSTDYYIAFKYLSTHSSYWFLDDVVVENIPSCGPPSGLVATMVTSTAATLSWNGNANLFNIYYKAASESTWEMIPNVTLSSSGYTILNLLPTTTYQWYVASLCDGDTIISLSTASFTTPCNSFSVPFTEDFDASSSLPSCWARYNGWASDIFAGGQLFNATTGWNFTNTYVFGANHARVNIYGNTCNRWLVTPPIDLSGLTNPALVFELALTAYNSASPISNTSAQADDKFMVIVSTDYGATWSAANATVWSNDGTGDYVFNQISATGQEITISLADYANETVMIAFYAESTIDGNGDNDLHIDNVVVSYATTCIKPTNLTVNGTTATSANLSWTENGSALNWNIQYGPTGFTLGSANATVVPASTNPFTVDNLTTGTSYDFYVQSDCGAESSYWVGPVTAIPGTMNMAVSGNSTVTTCSLVIYDNGGATGNYSANCNSELVIYPETAGSYVGVSGSYTTENNNDYLRIYDGVGTTGSMLGQFSGSGTIASIVSPSGPMTIRFTSDNSVQQAGFVLNVSCSSCAPPAGLTVDNITHNHAEISWNDNGAGTWLVEYKTANATTWTEQLTTDTMVILNNLATLTNYMVRVSSACGGGEYSLPAEIAFATTMAAEALPYSTDFSATSDQNWTLLNGNRPNYWTIGSLGNESALFITNNGTTAGYAPNGAFSVVSAEKLFAIGETAEISISFDVKVGGESTYDYLKVFFAPADAEFPASHSFVNYSNYDYGTNSIVFPTSLSAYPYMINLTGDSAVHVEVIVPNPNSNPTSNSTGKLVFLWKNDQSDGSNPGAIIYNVSLEAVTCPAPINLVVSNLTTTSADVSWTPTGDENDWVLQYTEVGSSNWTTIDVSNFPICALVGLTPGSTYEVCVQSYCSSDNQSIWVCREFSTYCETVVDFPYTEDFENGGVMADCWMQEYVLGAINWTVNTGNHNPIAEAHGGAYNAYFYHASQTNNTTKLISPIFDLTNLSSPYVTYWYSKQAWGNDQDFLTVYYRTSPSAPWQQLQMYTTSVETWTKDSLLLPNPSATYQIAFEGLANYGNGITLDDITVNGTIDTTVVPEPCVAPTGLTAGESLDTESDHSIVLSWIYDEDVSLWNVQYKKENNDWTTISVNVNSYQINNVIPDVQYYARVQAVCDDENVSDWSYTVSYMITGIDEYLLNSINLYPNPANDVVNVQCTMNNVQVKALEVFDVYGKLIRTVETVCTPSLQTQINVSDLASGMYFVRVTTEQGTATKSFVKK